MKFRAVKKYLKKRIRQLQCKVDMNQCPVSCCNDCPEPCGKVCRHAFYYRLNGTCDCSQLLARQALKTVRDLQQIKNRRRYGQQSLTNR